MRPDGLTEAFNKDPQDGKYAAEFSRKLLLDIEQMKRGTKDAMGLWLQNLGYQQLMDR